MNTGRTRSFAGAALALGLAVSLVGPASAEVGDPDFGDSFADLMSTPRDGNCDDGELCFYYNSYFQGAVSDFGEGVSIPSYGSIQPSCYEFKGEGPGQGECMNENVASVRNRTDMDVCPYLYGGPLYIRLHPGDDAVALASFKNRNTSHTFGC